MISDIRPRHTSTALAAHLCAAAHKLGSTDIKYYITRVYIYIYFMYYITIKVVQPIYGLGIILYVIIIVFYAL